MNNEILYEINGIKYVLIEIMFTSKNVKRATELCEKYDAIYQGVSKIDRGGLFSNAYAVIKVLVPEQNIIAFNKDNPVI